MGSMLIAAVVVLVVVAALAFYFSEKTGTTLVKRLYHQITGQENFVSQKAKDMGKMANDVFKKGGVGVPYTEFRKKVPGADPVVHNAARNNFRQKGTVSPFVIQKLL
jgi:hypothetical protein